MLESLQVSDYRSCIDTKISFQPDLSVLIGPNGSGKTNILRACLLLRSAAADPTSPITPAEAQEASNQSILRVSFGCEGKSLALTSKLRLLTEENNADVVVSATQSWYARAFTGNAKRITTPLWLFQQGNRERLIRYRYYGVPAASIKRFQDPFTFPELNRPFEAIGRFIRGMKYYSASQFTDPSQCPVSFEVEQEGDSRRGLRLRGHSRFLYDLYRARPTSDYEQFFNVVGPNGIRLIDKIDFKEILTSSIEYTVKSGGKVQQRKREKMLVIPQFTIGRNELSPSQLSEGTFKTITLLFYLMTEQSSALLIEEPEVCVHHGLLSSIVELIKTYSEKKQIIISTHSDFVLDQVAPRNVYKVTRASEEGTTVNQIARTISARELTALKRYLETEGNLGEYWRHGGFD